MAFYCVYKTRKDGPFQVLTFETPPSNLFIERYFLVKQHLSHVSYVGVTAQSPKEAIAIAQDNYEYADPQPADPDKEAIVERHTRSIDALPKLAEVQPKYAYESYMPSLNALIDLEDWVD